MTEPPIQPPRIAVAIATHQREPELARLLSALAASNMPFAGGIFVADNAASPDTQAVCDAAPVPAVWLPRSFNNGPGPAWNTAAAAALADTDVSHILVLDDDVIPPPETVEILLEAMGRSAGVAAPLLFDGNGQLWGFPEPVDPEDRKIIRRVHQPSECRAVFGAEPQLFSWATGACLLYAREAFGDGGGFREDFWMLGEDLEFSMRTAARLGGVFSAKVAVPHIPPPPAGGRQAAGARMKFLALLQNLSYLAFHSPHSAHLRWYLPGNFRRYLGTEGFSAGNIRDALTAFHLGALRGLPAGHEAGHALRHRATRRLGNDRLP